MWPGQNNGNVPPGMWSAPGHGAPMMESQWSAHYQQMPQNQVDWASLAQQWIAMKDSMPPEPPVPPQISGPQNMYGGHHQPHMPPHSMPTPPPPPSINQHHLHHQTSRDMSEHAPNSYQHSNYEDEGGMANMDLEEPEEPYVNHKPMPDVYHTARRHPSSPHPPGQYLPKHIHEQNKQRNFYQRQNSMGGPPGSWNNQHPGQFGGNSSHQHMMQDDPNAGQFSNMGNLDAAARNKLPVWIRQGLEKMERDKQKKEQDERRALQREERLKKQRELELRRSPGKSKFDDMNSDASDDDDHDNNDHRYKPPPVRKSRFDQRREPEDDVRREPPVEDKESERSCEESHSS